MKFKYTGVLSKPRIRTRGPGPQATEKEREAWKQEKDDTLMALFTELYRVHGVEPYDWMSLAMKLALAHVPGFRYEKARRGPRPSWDNMTRAILRLDVSIYIDQQNRGLSVSRACEHLATREPYKSKLRGSGRNPGEALRRQYNLASPLWIKVVRAARAFDQFAPLLSEEKS